MKGTVRSDKTLLWTTLLLVLVGMVTVYTASAHVAETNFGGSEVFLRRNAVRAVLGFAAMAIAYAVDYRSYRKHAKKAILLAVCLLAATLVFGKTIRGARHTLVLIQPGEIAKLALVFYLADVLARRKDELRDFRWGLLPRLVIVGVIVGLIMLQPDYGNALAVILVSLVVLFIGGARLLHMAGLGIAGVAIAWFGATKVSYIVERCSVWLPSFRCSLDALDTRGAGYQIYQSLVALGSGGVLGRGIGASVQRSFIPDAYTDFAFSIWGEERGLIGTMAVVGLFALLMVRGLRIARRTGDLYGSILASGLTVMITAYAIINVAVATASMPITGLPLPFVSYGGSSLIINMAAVGVLLNMSKRVVLEGSPGAEPAVRGRRALVAAAAGGRT